MSLQDDIYDVENVLRDPRFKSAQKSFESILKRLYNLDSENVLMRSDIKTLVSAIKIVKEFDEI